MRKKKIEPPVIPPRFTLCDICGEPTSKIYLKNHAGFCKKCYKLYFENEEKGGKRNGKRQT